MSAEWPDVQYVEAGSFGDVRAQTQLFVVHATDNTASAKGEASYATWRPDGTSVHLIADEWTTFQTVPLDRVAYGCFPTGNARSVQIELCGRSDALTDATLRRAAPIVRRACDKFGIPLRHVGAADLRAGVRGICGHADVTAAWHEGDHTDPGASFPWDRFISYVKGETMTAPAPLTGIDHAQVSNTEHYLQALINMAPKATGISNMSREDLEVGNKLAEFLRAIAADVAATRADVAAIRKTVEALQAAGRPPVTSGTVTVQGTLAVVAS